MRCTAPIFSRPELNMHHRVLIYFLVFLAFVTSNWAAATAAQAIVEPPVRPAPTKQAPVETAEIVAAAEEPESSAQVPKRKVVVEADRRYDALTWMQNSSEYRQQTTQAYRYALVQLAAGLSDKKWSADEVQSETNDFAEKPPAVILDVDETVLDNSAYNARNVINGRLYRTEAWNDWCREGNANPIPGAIEFVKHAEGLGAKVFFVTNRVDEVKSETIANLTKFGVSADAENVLTKNSDAGRDGDKISRRAMVAANYRIVLLIGDNLGDFCGGMDVPNTKIRNQLAMKKRDLLGSRWIMLPNPVYGSWQRALPRGVDALYPKQVITAE